MADSWMNGVLKQMVVAAVLLVAVMIPPVVSMADESKPETPATLEGVKVISASEAKALADGKGAKFFDMRSAINYGKGHLPGAVALPYKENSEFSPSFDASKDTFDLKKLPADKNTPIVFYSDGPTGWKSYKAAFQARKAGYKKVMWMREGTKGWEAKNLPLQQ